MKKNCMSCAHCMYDINEIFSTNWSCTLKPTWVVLHHPETQCCCHWKGKEAPFENKVN